MLLAKEDAAGPGRRRPATIPSARGRRRTHSLAHRWWPAAVEVVVLRRQRPAMSASAPGRQRTRSLTATPSAAIVAHRWRPAAAALAPAAAKLAKDHSTQLLQAMVEGAFGRRPPAARHGSRCLAPSSNPPAAAAPAAAALATDALAAAAMQLRLLVRPTAGASTSALALAAANPPAILAALAATETDAVPKAEAAIRKRQWPLLVTCALAGRERYRLAKAAPSPAEAPAFAAAPLQLRLAMWEAARASWLLPVAALAAAQLSASKVCRS